MTPPSPDSQESTQPAHALREGRPGPSQPAAGQDPSPADASEQTTLHQIQTQYETADNLLIALAGRAMRTPRAPARQDQCDPDQEAAVVSARYRAFHRLSGWAWPPDTEPASLAWLAVVNAIAATELADQIPQASRKLAAAWTSATQVRAELQQLGPDAESTALRLLTTWAHPIEALPALLRGLLR